MKSPKKSDFGGDLMNFDPKLGGPWGKGINFVLKLRGRPWRDRGYPSHLVHMGYLFITKISHICVSNFSMKLGGSYFR